MLRSIRANCRRAGVAPGLILLGCLTCCGLTVVLAAGPVTAAAQEAAQRVVEGKVENGAGAPLKATVYLKDGHTLAVRSYIAGDDGSYHFGQLAQNSDYQIWAEANGKKSETKNISSFDTRTQFNITLKIK